MVDTIMTGTPLSDEQLHELGLVPMGELESVDTQSPESIQEMADYGNRVIWLDHDLCQEDDGRLMRYIIQWNRDDIGIPAEKRRPIYLFINSNGGELSAAFALYDTIITSVTPVYGINMSYAFSAAFYVLLACHKRYGMPHSWYMLHCGSADSLSMDYRSAHNMMKQWDQQIEEFANIVTTRTFIDIDVVNNYMSTDSYFSATKAYELGIIDGIISSIADVVKDQEETQN